MAFYFFSSFSMDLKYRRVNVIGAGRVGKVMAYFFSKYLGLKIVGICNQSLASGRLAAKEIGQGTAVSSLSRLEPADIYLIAVPDDKIEQIAVELKANQLLKSALVLHFSANLSSKAISVLDCHLASVHPMQSFSDFQVSIANFNGTYCAIETSEKVIFEELAAMFASLGAKPFPIKADAKVMYHAAAVIAANYTVTLAHVAKTCLLEAGIEDNEAFDMMTLLIQSVLTNLKTKKDCKAVLTGPIARGDIHTIKQHLDALQKFPQIKALYQVLGGMSLDLLNGSKTEIHRIKKVLESK